MGISAQVAEALLQAARRAAEAAYVPYSHFPVGAALLTEQDDIMTGCNVENASYGLTLCAERTALVKAVSDGQRQFKALAVWATERPQGSITPCGACRQFMSEFLSPACPVIYSDPTNGQPRVVTMGSLLPVAFGPDVLPGDSCPDTDSSTPDG